MASPYRFVLTLDDAERRKLADLQAAAIQESGRPVSAAVVVRKLIMAAEVRR